MIQIIRLLDHYFFAFLLYFLPLTICAISSITLLGVSKKARGDKGELFIIFFPVINFLIAVALSADVFDHVMSRQYICKNMDDLLEFME